MEFKWQSPVKALELWKPEIKAAATGANNEINVYDEIGEGMFSTGMTTGAMSEFLSSMGGEDVVLNINSPGGDMFEGLAIYNMLRDYEGGVKVRVMGLAASAASIIAMAGDKIEMSSSAFFMIHNAWSIAIGNKKDFEKASSDFAKFDDAMAKIYEANSNVELSEIVKMMDEETFISGDEAIEMGFADEIMGQDALEEEETSASASALRKMDIALAKSGMPRSERRELIKSLTSTPSAADTTPSASDKDVVEALKTLQHKINSLANGENT